MSEIKGQLLGIILTISIFGVVLGAMIAAFTSVSQTIGDKMTDAASTVSYLENVRNSTYSLKYWFKTYGPIY